MHGRRRSAQCLLPGARRDEAAPCIRLARFSIKWTPGVGLNIRLIDIPASATTFGFSVSTTGGHLARSMMFDEVSGLFAAMPVDSRKDDYRRAIVDDNVLGKPTFSSREKTYRHLDQLYSLDPNKALFRVLRQFAADQPACLPVAAMVCTFCRDAQLRQSFELIDSLKVGELMSRQRMEAHIEAGSPGRFSPAMRKSLAQNVSTTWTVAGHLAGRVQKVRAVPTASAAASTYSMLAGYLLGLRGELLLHSVFGRLVSPDPGLVIGHLQSGHLQGWVRFRHAGGVSEVDFSPLLTASEQESLHGAH